MRKKIAVLTGIYMLCLCAGCGQQADGAVQDRGQEISEADVSEAENDGAVQPADLDDGGQADAAQENEEPATSAEEGRPEEKESDTSENGTQLTAEELAEYTEWIQDHSNYGFLLSDWENPAQIDLYQVFYTSAGVGRPGTEEEKQAHIARWDLTEIETDFGAIDKAAVDALLLEKVGFTYDELVAKGSKGMGDWYYVETDSFCSESGDTNYCQFVCKDGVRNEDGTVVILQCEGDDWVRTCEVKVSAGPGHRRFLGNHIVEGWIRNQEGFAETHEEE